MDISEVIITKPIKILWWSHLITYVDTDNLRIYLDDLATENESIKQRLDLLQGLDESFSKWEKHDVKPSDWQSNKEITK